MNWESDGSAAESAIEAKEHAFGRVFRYVDYFLRKRLYINIFVLLLSAGLVFGYLSGINDKNYWTDTFQTAIKSTGDKFKILGTSFAAKSGEKFITSFKLAYSNSKDLTHTKSFHSLPKVHTRSKESIAETFAKKSFNTIADSKKLRWGELKWKLFSKVR